MTLYLVVLLIILVVLFWSFGKKKSTDLEETKKTEKEMIESNKTNEANREVYGEEKEKVEKIEEEAREEKLSEDVVAVYCTHLARTPFGEGIYIKSIDGEQVTYLTSETGIGVLAGERNFEIVVYAKALKKGFVSGIGESSYYGPVHCSFFLEKGKQYELHFEEEHLTFICQERK